MHDTYGAAAMVKSISMEGGAYATYAWAYATYAWAYATAYVFYPTQERDFINLLNTERDFQLMYCRASMKLNQQY